MNNVIKCVFLVSWVIQGSVAVTGIDDANQLEVEGVDTINVSNDVLEEASALNQVGALAEKDEEAYLKQNEWFEREDGVQPWTPFWGDTATDNKCWNLQHCMLGYLDHRRDKCCELRQKMVTEKDISHFCEECTDRSSCVHYGIYNCTDPSVKAYLLVLKLSQVKNEEELVGLEATKRDVLMQSETVKLLLSCHSRSSAQENEDFCKSNMPKTEEEGERAEEFWRAMLRLDEQLNSRLKYYFPKGLGDYANKGLKKGMHYGREALLKIIETPENLWKKVFG